MSWYPSHEPLIPLPSTSAEPITSHAQASSSNQSNSLLDLISSSPLESRANPLFPERKSVASTPTTRISRPRTPPSRPSDELPSSPGFGDFVSVPPSADPLGDFGDFAAPIAEQPLSTRFVEDAKARSAEKERQVMDEFRQAESGKLSPPAKPVRESSITHDNPFSHSVVPPSGAPGYTGEKWDKGFGDDVVSNNSGSRLKLLGRTEMTTPILTVETAEKLRPYLPALRRLAPKWSLLYSLDQHGISLATFYARCEQPATGGCLVAIRDSEGATFGVWCGDGVRRHEGYAGTGESNGKFGLYLDSALLDGESGPCPTFDNEPLCSGGASSTGTVKYECVGVEAWSII
ncbi:oxidation resistance protein 1 [Ceratobasidium sp. 423]|nr:oxidation resistance protein 1 [Ceratobasidium sp. 423]